jgi:hypothetical protein
MAKPVETKFTLVNKFKIKVNDLFDFALENIPKLYNATDSEKYVKEIRYYQDQLEAGFAANSILILDEFSLNILPYVDRIYACDINYMLNETKDSTVLGETAQVKLDFRMFKIMWNALDFSKSDHDTIKNKIIDKTVRITKIAENYFALVYGIENK